MENPFNSGDTVRLKSGGPVMTITAKYGANEPMECTWYSEKEEAYKFHKFYAFALDKVK